MNEIISHTNEEVLLIDKPEGFSSYDVIRKIKKNYPKGTKIGHTGTLDPFATGLLIILIGKATKRQDEFHLMNKVYRVKARFNKATDTLDKTGKVTDEDREVISIEAMRDMIQTKFKGEIDQMPPKFSAKHVNGQRAYDLARAGIEFELKPKRINVIRFDIVQYTWPEVIFEIECGSGTYIRSLISDLALELGTHAYCEELRRTKIGEYKVEKAVKLTEDLNEG